MGEGELLNEGYEESNGNLAYSPSVPTNWDPAPTLTTGALDQLAAKMRPYYDNNEVVSAYVDYYIETTGSDATGVANDPTHPFLTLEGAVARTAFSSSLGLFNFSPVYRFGAGTFEMAFSYPDMPSCFVTCAHSDGISRTITSLAQNTVNGGNAVVLSGAAFTLNQLKNKVAEIRNAAGTLRWRATVYANDAGNTVYFETDSTATANPAILAGVVGVGDTFTIINQDTIFAQTDTFNTTFFGCPDGIYWGVDPSAPGFIGAGGDWATNGCSIEVSGVLFNAAYGQFGYMTALQGGVVSVFASSVHGRLSVIDTATAVMAGGSTIDNVIKLFDGHASLFLDGANSSSHNGYTSIEAFGESQIFATGNGITVFRVTGPGRVFVANDTGSGFTHPSGGDYSLPDLHTAGGLTGVGVRVVEATAGARVRIGSLSSVIIGGETNPVSADNGVTSSSTAFDGTRIVGGRLSPGPAGVTYRAVSGDTSWDPDADDLVALDTAAAPRNIDLPAANSVSCGVTARISRPTVSIFDLTVTPAGADTIDAVAAPFSFDSFFGNGTVSARTFASDGVSNWMSL